MTNKQRSYLYVYPTGGILYLPRWYFGGISATAAAAFTHPLDLIKVLLQTQHEKTSMIKMTKTTIKNNGILSLYNGISASLLRQLTYSLTRFGIYEAGKPYISTDTFLGKILLAGLGGAIGGFVGNPADLVNVRMQNDVKLKPEKRRNYKHAIDGLFRVYRGEGVRGLFSGAPVTSCRGLFMTVGQIAFYDQVKVMLCETPYFIDNFPTHITSSLIAGVTATLLTQPLDVVKTRSMNAKPGEFSGLLGIAMHTAKSGPLAFFKGFIPAFLRVGPNTVLLFVFFEQLRIHFGIPQSIAGNDED